MRWIYEQFARKLVEAADPNFDVPDFAQGLHMQQYASALWLSGQKGGEVIEVAS
jgi:uncharacterized membrane protein